MTTCDEYHAFARGQAAGVSPSYEALALAVAEHDGVIGLLGQLPRGKQQTNLLFGVARHLGGPVASPSESCAWVVGRWADVRPELLARTTQTNEAGRCATLLPVLAGMPGPLALLEVGVSAGLCLYPDRYRYDYGRGVVGDNDGPVLECAWLRPEPPPTSLPEVVWRAGLDLNPLDVPLDSGGADGVGGEAAGGATRGAARGLARGTVRQRTQPGREGPEVFLTALDGIPVGWCGPHGQFCD